MATFDEIPKSGGPTPTTKALAFIAGLLLIVIAVIAAFYMGKQAGESAESSKYQLEREKNLQKIARFEANEAQFAAENALLKKQHEATAEILIANDKKLAVDAAKFDQLIKERNERNQNIDLDSNYDSQLCGLCSDGERSGFARFSFCGRCQNLP